MSNLPKHILEALKQNKTSLGEHPSYPPEEEEKFIVNLVTKTFNELSEKVGIKDSTIMKQELGQILSECKKLESKNREALEELCGNIINDLFQIPEDTIEIEAKIVDKIDTSLERLIPEKTTDFSFDDINDMNNLTNEIYKRRLLNALVAGAAIYYTNNIGSYVKQLFDIDSFIKRAESVIQQKKLALNETRWILSTDSDRAEEEFRKKYGDLIITSSLFKRGHSKTGAKNPDGFTRAVIDLSLLGRCDYLVLTAHSTFSVMARSLSRNESESFVMPSRGYA